MDETDSAHQDLKQFKEGVIEDINKALEYKQTLEAERAIRELELAQHVISQSTIRLIILLLWMFGNKNPRLTFLLLISGITLLLATDWSRTKVILLLQHLITLLS